MRTDPPGGAAGPSRHGDVGGTVAVVQITDDSHSAYDLGLLQSLRRAWPGARVLYLTSRRRAFPDVAGVEQRLVPSGSFGRRTRLSPLTERAELGRRLQTAFSMARRAGAEALVIAYFESWSSLWSVRALIKWRDAPVLFAVHNHVARVAASAAERCALRGLLVAAQRRGRTRFWCLEPPIRLKAAELYPRHSGLFVTAPYPLPVAPDAGRVEGVPRGLLYLGRPGARKAFGRTVALLGRVRDQLGEALEQCPLRFVGEGMGEWPALAGPGVEVCDTTLSDQQWTDAIRSARFLFLPYGDVYQYNASGVLYDAFANGRPVIVSDKRALVSAVQAAPGLGYVFSSDDEFCDVVRRTAALSHGAWASMSRAVQQHAVEMRNEIDRALTAWLR